MSNNSTNNLLQFLKKKDLFNNSPTKRRSSRSRSQERNIQIRPTTVKPAYEDDVTKDILNQLSAKKGDNLPQPRQYSPIHNYPLEEKGLKLTVGETRKIRNTQDAFEAKDQIMDNFWPQLVSYSQSFQSARIEASKSLQRMGGKLKNEIASINETLQNFNAQMQKVVVNEINNLRQRILQIVEEVFKESQKHLQGYLKFQEEKLCKDLIVMKDFLLQQYKRIEGMKEEIGKPEWRKITGKIIANEEERKINEICKKSSSIDVTKWNSAELIGYRIKDFQRELRDALHLGKLK